MFLGKTIFSHSASLHPGEMPLPVGAGKFNGGGSPEMD